MKLHLAGTMSLKSAIKKVNLDLIETSSNSCTSEADLYKNTFILESFYYANEFTEKIVIPNCKDFLLDSGAFTFMSNTKKKIDWNDYIDKYIEFINRNKIKKYFELDIDSIVGFEKVLEIRQKLKKGTGIKPIPVWHRERGIEQFIEDAKNYQYVSIGGLVGMGYARKDWKYFPWFIDTAHKYGAKIHALGFTALDALKKYHFDSVDSTSWLSGNKFGAVYHFNGKTMIKVDKPAGKKVKTYQVLIHNFNEWKKFSQYAEKNL